MYPSPSPRAAASGVSPAVCARRHVTPVPLSDPPPPAPRLSSIGFPVPGQVHDTARRRLAVTSPQGTLGCESSWWLTATVLRSAG